ncbi:type II toxin-antitoxin system PrlF family antitoxin [Pseudomonas aeruginosa]
MLKKLSATSTLTDRYQTTIPEMVRKALGLMKGDRLNYSILPDGRVQLSRDMPDQCSEKLKSFLRYLQTGVAFNDVHIKPLDSKLVDRIHALIDGAEVDVFSPLPPDDFSAMTGDDLVAWNTLQRAEQCVRANDWQILAHSYFEMQLKSLIQHVEKLKSASPSEYKLSNDFKRLAAVAKVALEVIPLDPMSRARVFTVESIATFEGTFRRVQFLQTYSIFYLMTANQIFLVCINDGSDKPPYGSPLSEQFIQD